MSTCEKIGYAYSGEIPQGYRATVCDPCDNTGECCKWISFSGFHCPTGCLCCPHPTGAVMFANNPDSNLNDSYANPSYYFVDNPVTKLSGYNDNSPSQIDLGLISMVDDAGIEYMSELRYAVAENDSFNYGNVFRLTISSPMEKNKEMCTTYGCSGAVEMGYWHSGNQPETTPTPALTLTEGSPSFITESTWFATQTNLGTTTTRFETQRNTNDPTYTDTNTAKITGDDGTVFRTFTSTASGTTEGTGYLNHSLTTPAGTTDTSIDGVIQECFTPTPTPMYIDTTSKSTITYGLKYTTSNWATTNEHNTYTQAETPVQDSPSWNPFVSGLNTSLETGEYGGATTALGNYSLDEFYFEPLIGAKIIPVDQYTDAKTYLFCTDGENFKRLGTGTYSSGNTAGEPFSLYSASSNLNNEFDSMTGLWPYTYIPSRSDCFEIALNKYTENGTTYANTGSKGLTEFDASLSTNPYHTPDRLKITGFGTDRLSFGQVKQTIWHPTRKEDALTPENFWTKPMALGGFYQALHNWHGCIHESYAVEENGLSNLSSGTSGRAFSQKSFLDSVNNWIRSKLGNDWRIARANEVIKDFIPPRNSCRMIHTHSADSDSLILNTGGFHSYNWDRLEVSGSAYNESWFYENCGNCTGKVLLLSDGGEVTTTNWQTEVLSNVYKQTATDTFESEGSLTTRFTYTQAGNTTGPEGTSTPTPAGNTIEIGTTYNVAYNPTYSNTLTTTFDYGTRGTQNPVGVTPTPEVAFTPVTLGVASAVGTNTSQTLTTTLSGYTNVGAITSDFATKTLTNLGNEIGAYVTRRWSDWCIYKRGCEEKGSNALGLFGMEGSANDSCKLCNDAAYTNTNKNLCKGYDYIEYIGAKNFFDADIGIKTGFGYTNSEYTHTVASKETAQSLGNLWNIFYHDWAIKPNNTKGTNDPSYNHASSIDVTSWIDNPSSFYGVSKDNYDKSRCCSGGKPSKEDWNGVSCFNLKSGNYCYSGEEITIDLGTGTGDFEGVVAGGAYWNDVTQTGATDDLVSGNVDSQYSLGYGLMYHSGNENGALTGNTDDGDSRYLRHHTKTWDGKSGESGSATFVYVAKVYEGTNMPAGSGLVTCPGKTGDTSCYNSSSVPLARSGEEGEEENVVWGSGGKTYIKGMISPAGGCAGECDIKTGIKICYGKFENERYSGYSSLSEACEKECESGNFTGWVIHEPESKRGYKVIDDKNIPKENATIYSGQNTNDAIKATGDSGYYYIEDNKYIQINSNGIVTKTGACSEGEDKELKFIANGHSDNWTQPGPACTYPNLKTFGVNMIFTGNGEEVSVEQEDCVDFYIPSIGTNVKVAEPSGSQLPDGNYYYGIACMQEPTMVGYYAKLNITNNSGQVMETGECSTTTPYYPIEIYSPDWSVEDTKVGWPSSGTLCSLLFLTGKEPHSEHGNYPSTFLVTTGYCTGITQRNGIDIPTIGSENIIRSGPSTDSPVLFDGDWPKVAPWYFIGAQGGAVTGAVVKIDQSNSFFSSSGNCMQSTLIYSDSNQEWLSSDSPCYQGFSNNGFIEIEAQGSIFWEKDGSEQEIQIIETDSNGNPVTGKLILPAVGTTIIDGEQLWYPSQTGTEGVTPSGGYYGVQCESELGRIPHFGDYKTPQYYIKIENIYNMGNEEYNIPSGTVTETGICTLFHEVVFFTVASWSNTGARGWPDLDSVCSDANTYKCENDPVGHAQWGCWSSSHPMTGYCKEVTTITTEDGVKVKIPTPSSTNLIFDNPSGDNSYLFDGDFFGSYVTMGMYYNQSQGRSFYLEINPNQSSIDNTGICS